MNSVEDLRKMHAGNTSNNTAQHLNPGAMGRGGSSFVQYPSGGQYSKTQQSSMYIPHVGSLLSQNESNDDLDYLTRGVRGMNLSNPPFGSAAKPSPQMSTQSSHSGGVPNNNNVPTAYVCNGQIFWASNSYGQHGATQGQHGMATSPNNYSTAGANYVGNGTYAGYPSYPVDNSPSWATSRVPSSELPTLITPRRDSSSSNENDVPGTPFTQYTGYGDVRPGVAVVDNSPQSLYWTTPSPSQARFGNFPGGNVPKPHIPSPIPLNLQMLCQQDPPIPKAVPAPYSPHKALDKALENPYGVTNVYIRGLQPNTTDDMLHMLASRFGDIASSKSIIDHSNGMCKGFGFVKYHNFKDAENCIRGFHWCGYETSFARESFYSQLKKLSDEQNTNLYVSNLPKDMNEHELRGVFLPYETESTRILRHPDGSGRGVGFARFKNRDVCEAVIKTFNNKAVQKADGEEHCIQIRFADTPEQKALKAQTTAARQYRTAEYESQTQSPIQMQANQFPARPESLTAGVPGYENDFGQYMNMNGMPQAGQFGQSGNAQGASERLQLRERGGDSDSHLSPNSAHTVVNVSFPSHPIAGPGTHASSTDGDEKTITASTRTSAGSPAKKDEPNGCE